MRPIDADRLLKYFEDDPEDARIAIGNVIFLINESPTIKLPINKPKPPKCGREGKPVTHMNQFNQAWNQMIMEERNTKPV